MAALNQRIKGKVAGTDVRLTRTYRESVPPDITINKAWMTVKAHKEDADDDAIIGPKAITTSLGAAGQITDATTTSDFELKMFFDLLDTETILCAPKRRYHFDVKIRSTLGLIFGAEVGTIEFEKGVTQTIL